MIHALSEISDSMCLHCCYVIVRTDALDSSVTCPQEGKSERTIMKGKIKAQGSCLDVSPDLTLKISEFSLLPETMKGIFPERQFRLYSNPI